MFYYYFLLSLSIFHLVGAKLDIYLYDSKENLTEGEIVGFADFNSDHFTDIFYLSEAGSQLNVILMSNQPKKQEKFPLAHLHNDLTKRGYKIRSIVLSDFEHSATVDVVILLSIVASGPYDAYLCKHDIDSKLEITLNAKDSFATFEQQPLVFFYDDNDMTVLLAMSSTDKNWKIWNKENDGFIADTTVDQLNAQISLDTTKRPMYSLFFDADMDYSSEVMLTDYVAMSFKFYKRGIKSYFIDFATPHKEIDFPANAEELAQPVAADWLRKNHFGLLLAYCIETECSHGNTKLAVHNLKNDDNWEEVHIKGDFRMTINNKDNAIATRPLMASMRTVDLNLDGCQDVVTTLLNKNDESVIGILINECNQDKLEFKVSLFEDKYASEVIPFDFMEDGVPDLLINRENKMEMYNTSFYKDNYDKAKFLKISVITSLCTAKDCNKLPNPSDHQSISYGLPISGASFSLKVNDTSGDEINMRGYAISSTSYLALQLPFYLFGLSKNIDQLQSVTVATATGWPSVGKLNTIKFQTHIIINPFFFLGQVKWLSVTRKITNVETLSSDGFSLIHIISIPAGSLAVIFLVLMFLRYVVFRPKQFIPMKGARKLLSAN